jgi:hypothetical protein
MKKNLFLNHCALVLVMLFVSLSAMAQNKVNFTLKGKVSDKTDVIVGASVVIEGTSLGSVTDANGNFTVVGTIDEGEHNVVVSSVGFSTFRQMVNIKSGINSLDATLAEDVLNLGEVLVVGSSVTQERKQLGNSISTVRADQLTRSGSGNVIQSLQGKVAGAQITQNSGDPAGGITVRLRGQNRYWVLLNLYMS